MKADMNADEIRSLAKSMDDRTMTRPSRTNPYLVGIQANPAHDWAVSLFFGALLGVMFFWGV